MTQNQGTKYMLHQKRWSGNVCFDGRYQKQFNLRYIHSIFKRGKTRLDPHWKPMHLQCPFCLLDFTVYAKVEELEEDTAYFSLKSNLTQKFNVKLKKNSNKNSDRYFSSFR